MDALQRLLTMTLSSKRADAHAIKHVNVSGQQAGPGVKIPNNHWLLWCLLVHQHLFILCFPFWHRKQLCMSDHENSWKRQLKDSKDPSFGWFWHLRVQPTTENHIRQKWWRAWEISCLSELVSVLKNTHTLNFVLVFVFSWSAVKISTQMASIGSWFS